MPTQSLDASNSDGNRQPVSPQHDLPRVDGAGARRPRRPTRSRARAGRAPRGSARAGSTTSRATASPSPASARSATPAATCAPNPATISTDRADAGTTTLGSRAASPSASPARIPPTHCSNRSASRTTCVWTNAAPAAILAASDAGGVNSATPPRRRAAAAAGRPTASPVREQPAARGRSAGCTSPAASRSPTATPGTALRQRVAAERQHGADAERGRPRASAASAIRLRSRHVICRIGSAPAATAIAAARQGGHARAARGAGR